MTAPFEELLPTRTRSDCAAFEDLTRNEKKTGIVLAKIGPLDNGLHVDPGFQYGRLCVRILCSWLGSRARTTEHRASVRAVDGLELLTLARANHQH